MEKLLLNCSSSAHVPLMFSVLLLKIVWMQAAQCAAVAGSGFPCSSSTVHAMSFRYFPTRFFKHHSTKFIVINRNYSLHSDYFKQQHGKHQWHVLASVTALQFSSIFSIDPISYKTWSCKITVSLFLTLFWSVLNFANRTEKLIKLIVCSSAV